MSEQYKDFLSKLNGSGPRDVYDNTAIRNSLLNILSTRRGSIPGKPNFGSDLHLLNFEQLDAVTEKLAERYTTEAISRHENRIIIDDISIIKNEAFNKLLIEISFSYTNAIHSSDTVSVPINL